MGLTINRVLAGAAGLAIMAPLTMLQAQNPEAPAATPAPRRPDSPSITMEVTDVSGAWEAMQGTRLRQSIESVFAIPFVAEDDSIAAINASLGSIATKSGIEPTIDSLFGENTRTAKLILFDEENIEDPTLTPYVLEVTFSSAELANAVGEVMEANAPGPGVLVRTNNQTVTMTNAPGRLMQDRMADWRAPLVNAAFEEASLEGAQMRFFAQPARDENPGRGDKISAGHVRFQNDRIDLVVYSLPASPEGNLRVPTGEGTTVLDDYVSLAEMPHIVSLAYHGAAAMLANAVQDSPHSRGRMLASSLERASGVTVDDLLVAFGEDAMLSINSMGIRSMFDFTLGITGAWEVRDEVKAAEILDIFRGTHRANLRRDADSYGRPKDQLEFTESEHRGLTVWSAPLMIFPIQPSSPPTLNVSLGEDVLFMATSKDSITALIDRHLDGAGDRSVLTAARSGLDLPEELHSLGTADFLAFSEVFRRALPVIVVLTQGGQEAQVFGRAFADVIGSLGQGTATGIYQPDSQSIRAAVLLAPPNPAP